MLPLQHGQSFCKRMPQERVRRVWKIGTPGVRISRATHRRKQNHRTLRWVSPAGVEHQIVPRLRAYKGSASGKLGSGGVIIGPDKHRVTGEGLQVRTVVGSRGKVPA